MRGGRRWAGMAALGLAAAAVGCVHTQPGMVGPAPAPIAVPPPGTVPVELNKIAFPPYVVEAPDILLIEVVQVAKVPVRDDKGDEVKDVATTLPDGSPNPNKGGTLYKEAVVGLSVQPVSGQFLVRPDGHVNLGFWGTVPVAGLTLEQAAVAIKDHIARSPALKQIGGSIDVNKLYAMVDVLAYNSKKYYVVLDGGGYGEQVYPFFITGSETVVDALANVNGLHAVASKRNIWVARRCPEEGRTDQILPVDWVGITQHGYTGTNYQVLPGDRIYVKAQRLVTIDTALSRIISPVERLFGVTLLGASTVNQINGRFNNGFNNP